MPDPHRIPPQIQTSKETNTYSSSTSTHLAKKKRLTSSLTTCYYFLPYSDFLSKVGGNQVQKVEVDGVHVMFTLKQDVDDENNVEFGATDKRFGGFSNSALMLFNNFRLYHDLNCGPDFLCENFRLATKTVRASYEQLNQDFIQQRYLDDGFSSNEAKEKQDIRHKEQETRRRWKAAAGFGRC
ncbi:hypothetical protein Tco_0942476 [Tanacetum coccineum]